MHAQKRSLPFTVTGVQGWRATISALMGWKKEVLHVYYACATMWMCED